MKLRSFGIIAVLLSMIFVISSCEKKTVEPAPPIDILTEEPYREHLDELNGSSEDVMVPAEAAVVVTSLQPNDVVTPFMTIEGKAKGGWYFEASFPVRILNDTGDELVVTHAEAQEDWMQPGYVPFKVVIPVFNPGSATSGTLVLEKDNPSGLPENAKQIKMPIRFIPGETTSVKVFFPNSVKDPEMMDCGNVFSVVRVIPKTPTVARAAVEELLKGPTVGEKGEGYITSLNSDVKVQRLVIEEGVAIVDFDEQLEYQVGGSCRIQSIHSQIRQTLMQFPTVKDVVISIDGRTEDILQP